ncbi:unnamed protein product [Caenorhabditis angaria]|uniref:Uncharacterized protein n=1 Tax=Caenorhabditis angaria TaxID=860376 RepID=A0A9P1IVW8_9PELO|nr:unnamed protein product [Caenorhabditis angaria]
MRTICETWVQLFLTDAQISPDVFQITYEIGGLVGTMASGIVIDLATRKFDVDATRRFIAFLDFLAGMFVNGSINVWCMIASQAGLARIQGTVSAFISFIASSGSMLAGTPLALLISYFGYRVFLYIFAIQLVIVLVVSSFRVRLRMQTENEKENENKPEEGTNQDEVTTEDSQANLTSLKKTKPRLSMLFAIYSSKKIRPTKNDEVSNRV